MDAFDIHRQMVDDCRAVAAGFAEFEWILLKELPYEWIVVARNRGACERRKPVLDGDQIGEVCRRFAAGELKPLLARDFRVGQAIGRRYLSASRAGPGDDASPDRRDSEPIDGTRSE